MSFRKKMGKQKKWLSKRHNQQTKNKDNRGRFPSIIDKSKLPAGVEQWSCAEGDHLIDIIPFEAGPDMPLDEGMSPVTPEGGLDYVLDLWVHQNIGTTKQQFVCPYENFGKDCPICEYMGANRLHKDDWGALRPKRRAIYLVWVHDTRDTERKGVQIWNASHHLMEEKLAAIAKNPRGGGARNFADFDDGENISFTRDGKGIGTKYNGHAFYPRQTKIPDKILDQSFSIDQVVKMHSDYDVIKEAFMGLIDKYESRKEVQEDEDAGSTFSGDDVPFGDDPPEEEPRRKRTSKHKRTSASKTSGKTTRTRTRKKSSGEGTKTKRTSSRKSSTSNKPKSTGTGKRTVRRRRK